MLPSEPGQIWAIIVITFMMAIPLTPLSVGFNALFAESVPVEYRAQVAAIRNVMLAVTWEHNASAHQMGGIFYYTS